jgi:hypothetical protein
VAAKECDGTKGSFVGRLRYHMSLPPLRLVMTQEKVDVVEISQLGGEKSVASPASFGLANAENAGYNELSAAGRGKIVEVPASAQSNNFQFTNSTRYNAPSSATSIQATPLSTGMQSGHVESTEERDISTSNTFLQIQTETDRTTKEKNETFLAPDFSGPITPEQKTVLNSPTPPNLLDFLKTQPDIDQTQREVYYNDLEAHRQREYKKITDYGKAQKNKKKFRSHVDSFEWPRVLV